MNTRVNITAVVANLIQSEGIEIISGCERDHSQAGALLSLFYGCPRWAAEEEVRKAVRCLARQSAHLLNSVPEPQEPAS